MDNDPVARADPAFGKPASQAGRGMRKLPVCPTLRIAFEWRPDQERVFRTFARSCVKQPVEGQSVEGRDGGHVSTLARFDLSISLDAFAASGNPDAKPV